jgi:hypothetical protein
MTITASVFAARYKLACFFIANHLFETVISVDPGVDLSSLSKLQRDQGFFMSSLRLVEQLTAFRTDHELETIQKKIENSGTMYFKKSILTAVVKQGSQEQSPNAPNPALPPGLQDVLNKPKLENLYDKFVVKRLYDSYFSAYVEDTEPLVFLDQPDSKNGNGEDLVSIFELGVFDSATLASISEILDFTSTVGANAAIQALSANPRYATYKHFFGLVSKCI